MAGIPPARDTDSEDVAWALQTAEALWKRNERADAIVWLRRAAQAAAEIEDDDRAIALARDAAELTEWSAQRRRMTEPPPRALAPAPENDTVDELLGDAEDAEDLDVGDEYIEDITDDVIERGPAESIEEVTEDHLTRVRADSVEHVTLPEIAVEAVPEPEEEPTRTGGALASALRKLALAKEQAALRVAAEKAAAERTAQKAAAERAAAERAAAERAESARFAAAENARLAEKAALAARLPAPVPPPRSPLPARSYTPVPPSAYAAAASRDRTSDPPPPSRRSAPPGARTSVPPGSADREGRSSAPPSSRTPAGRTSAPPPSASPDVPTAAEVHAGFLDPWADSDRSSPRLPGDRPSVPGMARDFELDEIVTSAPVVVKPGPGSSSTQAKVSVASSTAAARTPPLVDLEGVEALSDLPDDERDMLARCAVVRDLGLGEDVSGFALVFVIEGNADVSAVQMHAPAMRLDAGTVLRGRGTLDAPVALRVVVSSNRARIATWSEQDVASAFRSCPWVEDDLCAAGDRAQALVGATMGLLGTRLDPELRYQVTGRLTLKVLAEGDVVFRPGDFVAGLHVVGGGRLELAPRSLKAGDFLLPALALRAGPAPSLVRAGPGGALLLEADRALAQELLVTCPPLLEILSSLT